MSASPCGCDPEANWLCQRHQEERDAPLGRDLSGQPIRRRARMDSKGNWTVETFDPEENEGRASSASDPRND